MEGVVDPIIRDLFSQIGGYDFMCTEFIRVTDRLNPVKMFYNFAPELKNQGLTRSGTPVYVQLLGGQPQPMAENAALAVELGAPGIDINFGCPAKTVNRHDGGASLLKKPERLFDVISAIKKAVPEQIPVSAKVRLGFEDKSLCNEIAAAVNQARAQHLTVHARTKIEGYKPPAHWHFIAQMKEMAPDITLIANGDIWTPEDYKECVKASQCTDVAVGRGAFARPSLANEIKQNKKFLSWNDFYSRWQILFINNCVTSKTEQFAIRRTKQWVKHLGRTYPQARGLFEQIKTKESLSDVMSLLTNSIEA